MSKSNGTTKEITPEMAQAVLQESIERQSRAFLDAYTALCEKHGCHLVATPRLEDGHIVAGITHLAVKGQMVEIKQQ